MKKLYTTLAGLLCMSVLMIAQHLAPSEGIKVAYVAPDAGSIQVCDVGTYYAYYNDGDSVYQVNLVTQELTATFPKPADYDLVTFPSFMTLSPEETSLWVGYTDLANADARIYEIDLRNGQWKLAAKMPGNYDLEFWNDSILVSGTNSDVFGAANAIWVLDTTGSNAHRKILETTGYSAGLAVDAAGNLYFGTSDFVNPNGLYRWSNAQVESLVNDPRSIALGMSDAELLSDLPMGVADCEVDGGGNLVFTMNTWGVIGILASWNGTAASGANYDTLATSALFLSQVQSRGDYTKEVIGNSILVTSGGMPVADVHTIDYPPTLVGSLPVIQGTSGETITIPVETLIEDLDDHDGPGLEISLMSVSEVASIAIDTSSLGVTLAESGQSNLLVSATSGSHTLELSTLVASWPVLEGDYLLAGFEDLSLEAESYWNGSDGSGAFNSGPLHFLNSYNAEWASWSGWAYSNTSDVSTAGFMNGYSAITGEGFPGGEGDAGIYGVTNFFGDGQVDFPDKAHAVEGMYVTNATYAALSMEQGDMFAKKFGGESGVDPDYFLLKAWGSKAGEHTDTLELYLADYRSEEAGMDYIVKTWQWFELRSLGKVDTVFFGLESSDMGDFGMNTPAYFCMDQVYVLPDQAPYVAHPIADQYIAGYMEQVVLDVSDVFSDPDDEDDSIRISIAKADGPFEAELVGSDLVLTHKCMAVKSAYYDQDVEVILEGELGGLSARDTFQLTMDCGSGINDEPFLGLQVYPNPSSGSIRIQASGMGMAEVRIYSLSGRELYVNTLYQSGDNMDISQLAPGAYILRLRDKDRTGGMLIQKQ